MTDRLLALLRSLPPDLPDPADRLAQVKSRVVRRRRRQFALMAGLAVIAVTVPLPMLDLGSSATSSVHPPAQPPTRLPADVQPLACPTVNPGARPGSRACLAALTGGAGWFRAAAGPSAGVFLRQQRRLGLRRLVADRQRRTRRRARPARPPISRWSPDGTHRRYAPPSLCRRRTTSSV